MNREILFRAQRSSNNGWVYGIPKKSTPQRTIFDAISVYDSWEKDRKAWFTPTMVFVIPETVGQYIGKTDKNRKKIFDGDILKGYTYPFYASDDNTFNYYAVVIWFEETCSYRLVTIKAPDSNRRGISEGNDSSFEEFQSEDWEIIGNVHDNPELLPEWILSWL